MSGAQYVGVLVAIGVCGAVVGFCTVKVSATLARALDQYRLPTVHDWLLVLGFIAISMAVVLAAMLGLPWPQFWAHVGRLLE